MSRALARLGRWWFSPLPRGRVAALRTIVYAYMFVEVVITRSWVAAHGQLSPELYQPLLVGRLLPLPAPTPLVVNAVEIALLVCAAVALSGRLVRTAGAAVFVLYLEWLIIAFSFGKVDHDRWALLVALAVLPTLGRAHWGDKRADEASGWAIRCIQVAVVATYLLAAFAKLRFGGLEWLNGATLMRAVLRRGTFLAEPLEDLPWVLVGAQYAIMVFELTSPLLLIRGPIARAWWWIAVGFHAITFAMITIFFLPHFVCLFSFRRLERIDPRVVWAKSGKYRRGFPRRFARAG